MATREGIYVGGHEIVQRYVGSRLVWEKFNLILIGSGNFNFTAERDDKVVINLDNANGIYSLEDLNRYKEATAVKRGGKTFRINSVQLTTRTGAYNEFYGSFSMSFRSRTDRDTFLRLGTNTSFYKNKR
ncbi:MAG: hypothetical protein E7E08_04375 [Streptococcus mitis]|nr:hypothetical protein [Streptococcus mitis]